MRYALCAALAALVCACGETTQIVEEPAPEVDVTTVALEGLRGEDIRGQLDGELGCSFAVGGEVLLIAMGNVDPTDVSEALAKRAGVVAELRAVAPGGYDGMVEGVTFSNDELSAEIETVQARETGDEQAAHNARLMVSHATGALRTYNGVWTCGP